MANPGRQNKRLITFKLMINHPPTSTSKDWLHLIEWSTILILDLGSFPQIYVLRMWGRGWLELLHHHPHHLHHHHHHPHLGESGHGGDESVGPQHLKDAPREEENPHLSRMWGVFTAFERPTATRGRNAQLMSRYVGCNCSRFQHLKHPPTFHSIWNMPQDKKEIQHTPVDISLCLIDSQKLWSKLWLGLKDKWRQKFLTASSSDWSTAGHIIWQWTLRIQPKHEDTTIHFDLCIAIHRRILWPRACAWYSHAQVYQYQMYVCLGVQ